MSKCGLGGKNSTQNGTGAVKLHAPVQLAEMANRQEAIENKDNSVWIVEKDGSLVGLS